MPASRSQALTAASCTAIFGAKPRILSDQPPHVATAAHGSPLRADVGSPFMQECETWFGHHVRLVGEFGSSGRVVRISPALSNGSKRLRRKNIRCESPVSA